IGDQSSDLNAILSTSPPYPDATKGQVTHSCCVCYLQTNALQQSACTGDADATHQGIEFNLEPALQCRSEKYTPTWTIGAPKLLPNAGRSDDAGAHAKRE